MFEMTDQRYKDIFDHINAALVNDPLVNSTVNLWLDFQIWKRRDIFSKGVVALCGEWPEKSTRLSANFAKVVCLPDLQTLPEIPAAIFALCDLRDQTQFIRDIIIPYQFHFRRSRTPPALVMMGAYRGAPAPTGPVSLLEFTRTDDSNEWLHARVMPLLGEMFHVTDLKVSGPGGHLDPQGPGYVLVAVDLTMHYLF